MTFQAQAERHAAAFKRLDESISAIQRGISISDDPAAVSPDRALVFDVVGPVANFAEAARAAGFEWLAEDYRPEESSDLDDADDETVPVDDEPSVGPMSRLYLTLPSLAGLKKLQGYWRTYAEGGAAPQDGAAREWWALFGYLSDVRVWSARDRVDPALAAYVEDIVRRSPRRPVRIELDLWFRGTDGERAAALAENEIVR